MNRTTAAYLAGIIDGEGSIYIDRTYCRKKTTITYRVNVYLTMCDKSAMLAIGKMVGKKPRIKPLPRVPHKFSFTRKLVAYDLAWHNSVAVKFIQDILPYLRTSKRKKALICLSFQKRYAPGSKGRHFRKSDHPKIDAMRARIKALS